MSLAYFASRLSEHIAKTPEGFLVATDCVLGRTGFQTYQVRELPQDALDELGIDSSNPEASVEIYRSPEEVFAPAAMASLEGKPLTFQHPNGGEFVDPTNFGELAYGHTQNIHKGKEPLESGDWPLRGDVIIAREPLIEQVEDEKIRELSIGYDYELALDGKRLTQTNIRGNHVAVVPKGRAGAEARIQDAAPAAAIEAAGIGSTGTKKEKPQVSNILKHLLGLGLKAYAADAKPEELAEAAEALKEKKEEKATDRRTDDEDPEAKAAAEKAAKEKAEKEAADKKAKDAAPANDKRARFHQMLDKILDKKDEEAAAEDVDLGELRQLLDEFFEEEAGEEEHQEGEEGEEGGEEEEPVAADAAADAEDVEGFVDPGGDFHPIRGSSGYNRTEVGEAGKGKKKRRARDEFIEPGGERGAEDAVSAKDVLMTLRPLVARSNDSKLIKAFNGQLARFTRRPGASSGGYAEFAGAARTRTGDGNNNQADRERKLQAAYDAARTGQPVKEVK